MRHATANGRAFIEEFEGLYLKAYHGAADRPGLLTIGYGHTDAAGPPKVVAGMTITKEEADQILANDLSFVEADVEKAVKVPLNDNQFDALVSFAFNCGAGALRSSSLLRKLNAGDYASVPESLMAWVNANGKRVQGLVRRRAAEGALFMKDSIGHPTSSKPDVPDITLKDIQHELNQQGENLREDGILGIKTLTAIMNHIRRVA